ncbi:unnamed protein product, partial [marine sediment metagenome]
GFAVDVTGRELAATGAAANSTYISLPILV